MRGWRSRLLPVLACAMAACGGEQGGGAPDEVPPPRLTTLDELEVAVQQNLRRGTLVSFWATW